MPGMTKNNAAAASSIATPAAKSGVTVRHAIAFTGKVYPSLRTEHNFGLSRKSRGPGQTSVRTRLVGARGVGGRRHQ
jgi:hypothetical protein